MALENNQIDNSNIDNDEISLKEVIIKINELFFFLKSKWKIIFFIGLIGALIGLYFGIKAKPIYKAVLTFALEEEKGSGLSGALGLANSFGIDLGGSSGGGAFAATNLAELMRSRLITEKVLLKPVQINGKNTTLAEVYIDINDLRKNWVKSPKLSKIQFLPKGERSEFNFQQDSLLKTFYNSLISPSNLSIQQKDKKVTIISIEVLSENELFSKLYCENLAKETSDFYTQTKTKKSKSNVEILQKQTDSIKIELSGAISSKLIEEDNVYNLNPALNKKGVTSKKKQIDVQTNTAILTNLSVQLELAKITLRKETPLIQTIDTPLLPLEKTKLGKLRALLFGGFIGVFLTIAFLLLYRFYKKVMQ
jgi:hypothetical protein